MHIERLISLLTEYVNGRHGSLYTSTLLRNNPNVCHACCLWFIDSMRRNGFGRTIDALATIDKSTFKKSQESAAASGSMPRAMVSNVRGSSQPVSDDDISALQYALDYHSQPSNYISDVVTFVANVVVEMSTSARNAVIIYMTGTTGFFGGSSGHVICMCRNVGGLLIYDPNIGIISVRMGDRDTWAEVLRKILRWYSDEMGLDRFGSKMK
jgi:hypothetical protein